MFIMVFFYSTGFSMLLWFYTVSGSQKTSGVFKIWNDMNYKVYNWCKNSYEIMFY